MVFKARRWYGPCLIPQELMTLPGRGNTATKPGAGQAETPLPPIHGFARRCMLCDKSLVICF
jgi:hypothetical protein